MIKDDDFKVDCNCGDYHVGGVWECAVHGKQGSPIYPSPPTLDISGVGMSKDSKIVTWSEREKLYEEINRKRWSKAESLGEGKGIPKETPSQATRKIAPEEFESRERYLYRKMGSLIGASKQWLRENEINEVITDRKRRASAIKEKIKAGDTLAVFDYIKHDLRHLGDPLVLNIIDKWQNEVLQENPQKRDQSRKYLKKIGECLVPSMKGIRKNVIREPEEVLKYYWGREWSWFRMLKYLGQRDWIKLKDKELDKGFTEVCKQCHLNKEEVVKMIDDHLKEGYEPRYSRIAAYETGRFFRIDEETVLGLVTKYQ